MIWQEMYQNFYILKYLENQYDTSWRCLQIIFLNKDVKLQIKIINLNIVKNYVKAHLDLLLYYSKNHV